MCSTQIAKARHTHFECDMLGFAEANAYIGFGLIYQTVLLCLFESWSLLYYIRNAYHSLSRGAMRLHNTESLGMSLSEADKCTPAEAPDAAAPAMPAPAEAAAAAELDACPDA